MSDSVRPHRQQPTRLPRAWDSPGKNTGVGCHFLLQCMKVKSKSEVAQSCPTLSDPMDCSPPGSSIHGIFQARVLEWGAIAFSRISIQLFKEIQCMILLTNILYQRVSNFFLNQIIVLVAQMSDSLRPHELQPTRLLCPWDSSGKNIGVSSHSILRGIFPTQRSNPGLPHGRRILYHLNHQGSPQDHRIVKHIESQSIS